MPRRVLVPPHRDTQEVVDFLALDPEHHVWMVAYGIGHGRVMTLMLHKGGLVDRRPLVACWCERFSGRLEGGPYRLAIDVSEELDEKHDELHPVVRLYDTGGAFELVCASIGFARPGEGFVQLNAEPDSRDAAG